MPTIFSHAIFASSLGGLVQMEQKPVRFWVLTAACAMLPDGDVVGFAFQSARGTMFGHRGITHSIVFALITGAVVAALFFRGSSTRWWKLSLYFSLATFSHPLLDMLTNGGSGVALLAPFSNERFFFPWRPVAVSPIGLRFFSERGWAVIASEIVWIWLPSALIFAVARLTRRNASAASGT